MKNIKFGIEKQINGSYRIGYSASAKDRTAVGVLYGDLSKEEAKVALRLVEQAAEISRDFAFEFLKDVINKEQK